MSSRLFRIFITTGLLFFCFLFSSCQEAGEEAKDEIAGVWIPTADNVLVSSAAGSTITNSLIMYDFKPTTNVDALGSFDGNYKIIDAGAASNFGSLFSNPLDFLSGSSGSLFESGTFTLTAATHTIKLIPLSGTSRTLFYTFHTEEGEAYLDLVDNILTGVSEAQPVKLQKVKSY